MEEYILPLLTKFDPSSLMLLLVLWGCWKVADKAMEKFVTHADKVSSSLEKISDDCHELRKDIAIVATKVQDHTVRIERVENKLGEK